MGFTDRERFHIWSLELFTEEERSREDGETRRGARAIVLLRNQPINQSEPSYATSATLLCSVHPSKYTRNTVFWVIHEAWLKGY